MLEAILAEIRVAGATRAGGKSTFYKPRERGINRGKYHGGSMTLHSAIHSDFLIHWTGRDIDLSIDPEWDDVHRQRSNKELEQAYLERIRNALRYGLWMTSEPDEIFGNISIPSVPKCCFTELKLSASRRHARKYGRLGIGVKRPFLFDRSGRPLVYVGFDSRSSDALFRECAKDLQNKALLNFFKPMNSDGRMLNYDLYEESEWRILYLDELERAGKIVDPKKKQNEAAHAFFLTLPELAREKLKYLLPLDGWLAMIIYPTIWTKNAAQQLEESGVLAELQRVKSLDDHGNRVEKFNWPIEMDLDACRNL